MKCYYLSNNIKLLRFQIEINLTTGIKANELNNQGFNISVGDLIENTNYRQEQI
jgi:hypothetical protein